MAPPNLLNLERVDKTYGRAPVLDAVSLGVAAGERIGVVGRNGGGKSTLLRVMAGQELADSGRVTRGTGLRLGMLDQAGAIDAAMSIREYVVGQVDTHDWASQATARDVLERLLGGFGDDVLDRKLGMLSGGEIRRVELARLLTAELDLLLLDEPTNHLDVEAIAWLAGHLRARRNLALIVVTHDRWFLDEVSDRTWEVVAGAVEQYEGGYSAFVLAKAERSRQAGVEARRRNNLIRKELAWLRRGAPARTSKPKFRIDAANQLIAQEPPPRNKVELLAFAGARLGKTVFELHDVSLAFGRRLIFDRVDWNVGPGDRIGIVGVNGAGKTTLLRTLLGELGEGGGGRLDGGGATVGGAVDDDPGGAARGRMSEANVVGKVVRGVTVKPAYLSQHLEELDPTLRVLEAVQDIAQRVELGTGRELTASQLCERLGFGSDAQWTPVADLSGGERRRLQLTRLLMAGPNVLILDEPTNDFDVETLAALEDLLDSFGGTILIVSHDRYFIERVCDRFVGLMGNGKIRDLPSGVDEYLRLRAAGHDASPDRAAPRQATQRESVSPDGASRGLDLDGSTASRSAAPESRTAGDVRQPVDERARRKELARLERVIAKADVAEAGLHEELAANATDHLVVTRVTEKLDAVVARRDEAEAAWLILAED